MRRYSLFVLIIVIVSMLLSGCVTVLRKDSMKAHGLDERFPIYFVGTEPAWAAGEMDSRLTAWSNVSLFINHPFNLPALWAIVIYNSFICEGNTNLFASDERKEVD